MFTFNLIKIQIVIKKIYMCIRQLENNDTDNQRFLLDELVNSQLK